MIFNRHNGPLGKIGQGSPGAVGHYEKPTLVPNPDNVYRRIADLAADYLIRESGCVPPPRAEASILQRDPADWTANPEGPLRRFLGRLLAGLASAIAGLGSRPSV